MPHKLNYPLNYTKPNINTINTIKTTIRNFLPNAKVYLYGSVPQLAFTTSSDYDIAIDNTKKIPVTILQNIIFELQKLLPNTKSDIIDLHNIPKEFLYTIKPELMEITQQNITNILKLYDKLLQTQSIINNMKKQQLPKIHILSQARKYSYKRTLLQLNQTLKALERLKEVLNLSIDSRPEVLDATIKRFEFTYELFWKLVKKYLALNNIHCNNPRTCFLELEKLHNNVPQQFLTKLVYYRNLTVHTYKLANAKKVYRFVRLNYKKLEHLILLIKQRITKMSK